MAQPVTDSLASAQIRLPVEATCSPEATAEAVERAATPGRFGEILPKP